jgi:presenilin-like A22 family membrane protease
MKHNWKITALILFMFVVTQFIGLYVIDSDPFHMKVIQENGTIATVTNPDLTWIQPPEIEQNSDFTAYLGSIIISFIIAIVILFLLIKFKVAVVLKVWFFSVIAIAIFITFNAIFPKEILSNSLYFTIPAAIIALGLSFLKMFKRNFLIHNLTELLIYPGIATIFVPILNLWSAVILLLIISVYDLWAVWRSGIMQKMAKYQMNTLKIFAGFFIPYVSKKMKLQMKKLKKDKKYKDKKMKVSVAILGGGDVIFPIITAGVVLTMKEAPWGLPGFTGGLLPAIFVIMGATLGLGLLFLFSQKKKFYPAMPFITAGILLGLILSYIIL